MRPLVCKGRRHRPCREGWGGARNGASGLGGCRGAAGGRAGLCAQKGRGPRPVALTARDRGHHASRCRRAEALCRGRRGAERGRVGFAPPAGYSRGAAWGAGGTARRSCSEVTRAHARVIGVQVAELIRERPQGLEEDRDGTPRAQRPGRGREEKGEQTWQKAPGQVRQLRARPRRRTPWPSPAPQLGIPASVGLAAARPQRPVSAGSRSPEKRARPAADVTRGQGRRPQAAHHVLSVAASAAPPVVAPQTLPEPPTCAGCCAGCSGLAPERRPNG